MTPAPSAVADDASWPALLIALCEVAAAAAAIDLDAADGNAVATERIWIALRRLLERALALLAALQCADEAGPGAEIGDVCFAGTMELRRVLRELIAAHDDGGRLVTAETGRRKMRRAIRAVLEAARAAGVYDAFAGESGGHHPADIESALAIRQLYARFRRSLRRATDDTPEAVLAAVRYAGGAIAALVSDPDYADVRASDRAVLRALRDRALHWARGDRSVPAGLHLLDDVWTCGDLLRGINRRQELRDHDRALIAQLGRGPDSDTAAWFARLEALVGLDDELDAVLDRARAARDTAPVSPPRLASLLDRLVPEALVRLAQVP